MVVSNYGSLLSYDYFDKLLRLENVKFIVLDIETRQYNIKINLAISWQFYRREFHNFIFYSLLYLPVH